MSGEGHKNTEQVMRIEEQEVCTVQSLCILSGTALGSQYTRYFWIRVKEHLPGRGQHSIQITSYGQCMVVFAWLAGFKSLYFNQKEGQTELRRVLSTFSSGFQQGHALVGVVWKGVTLSLPLPDIVPNLETMPGLSSESLVGYSLGSLERQRSGSLCPSKVGKAPQSPKLQIRATIMGKSRAIMTEKNLWIPKKKIFGFVSAALGLKSLKKGGLKGIWGGGANIWESIQGRFFNMNWRGLTWFILYLPYDCLGFVCKLFSYERSYMRLIEMIYQQPCDLP